MRIYRSLLLSAVVSLPCEVSTEAQTSDLELTRVSVDRFTVENTNLPDGSLLKVPLCRDYLSQSISALLGKNECHRGLASESGMPLS